MMDGTSHLAAKTSSDAAAQFVSILYAEDFDDPVEPSDDQSNDRDEPPPPITQADVDAACAEAVRKAQGEWQASQDQARHQTISAMAAKLAETNGTVEQVAVEAAEGVVATILSMVSGLLPQFSQQHGPAEVRALLARLLPVIRSQHRVVVRVHPDLAKTIGGDVANLDPNLAANIDVVAAPVEPGDVKVNWENGSMVRDTRQIVQAIQDVLGQLGLSQPNEAPAKRKMAYAD